MFQKKWIELIKNNDYEQLTNEIKKHPRLVKARDKNSCSTLLMSAAINGSVECSEVLIKAGAKLDVENSYKLTALMYGVMYQKVDIVLSLLQQGAKISIRNADGHSVLDMVMLIFIKDKKEIEKWFSIFYPFKDTMDEKDLNNYHDNRLIWLFS